MEFFEKAKNNLAVAQICFDIGFYDDCANRAYYGAFHAAIAALLDQGIEKGKFDHKWVQAEFNHRLIKGKKLYPGKFKSYLMKMQTVRDEADYSHNNVSKTKAQQQIRKAEELIEFIGRKLKK